MSIVLAHLLSLLYAIPRERVSFGSLNTRCVSLSCWRRTRGRLRHVRYVVTSSAAAARLRLRGGEGVMEHKDVGIASLSIQEENEADEKAVERVERDIQFQREEQTRLAEEIQRTSDRISQLEFKRSNLLARIRSRRNPTIAQNEPVGISSPGDEGILYEEPGFAWTDSGYGRANVSIYITRGIEGVGTLPPDQVTCEFSERSFEVRIKGLGGRNFRLQRTLFALISPQKSRFKVTKNQIHLTLAKRDTSAVWTELHRKWKPGPKEEGQLMASNKDPMGGIWNMMQEMYAEGDEKTKSLMKKAVWEAEEYAKKEREKEEKSNKVFKGSPGKPKAVHRNDPLAEEFPPGPPQEPRSVRPGEPVRPMFSRPAGFDGKEGLRNKPPPPPPPPLPLPRDDQPLP